MPDQSDKLIKLNKINPAVKPEDEASQENGASDKQGGEDRLAERVEKYRDVEGISTSQLDFGLWYVEHRRLLRLILIIGLVIISAVSWLYTAYNYTYYIVRGQHNDAFMVSALVETTTVSHDYLVAQAAREIIISPAKVLRSTPGNYDFIASVSNPNQQWWAEFDYYFLAGGQTIGPKQSFILPAEEKYLIALAEEFDSPPQGARLIIENIKWSRINRHQISDWQDYYDSHLDIAVEGIEFIPASQSGLSDKLNINQLSFKARNKTPYNYWQADFTILLLDQTAVVGVNRYSLPDFMSGELRPVQASWLGSVGRVSQVEIVPEINIMDNDIYIQFEGGVGEEK